MPREKHFKLYEPDIIGLIDSFQERIGQLRAAEYWFNDIANGMDEIIDKVFADALISLQRGDHDEIILAASRDAKNRREKLYEP